MKKVILIDGNNILFRSYYATAYKGNILRNSKGFPTNALYGFINMLNKIIKEESPNYMMIAFDKGKTFRHEKYKDYKDGRIETPEDLKLQFPVAKEIAKAMGITCVETDNYEADDIIGTFAKEVDINDDFIGTIISSDKDLLQLISNDIDVKLLKTNDFLKMNETTFMEQYGLTPDKMIDLKALMGDASDNIPGVKGIGEKTALDLLHKYNDLDGVYNNIDLISGKLKEKLINDKENAYFSKELATICKEVPIDVDLNKIAYLGIQDSLNPLLEEYEFYSLIKKNNINKETEKIDIKIVTDLKDVKLNNDYAMYLEIQGSYHDKNIKGLALYNKDVSYFILPEALTATNIFNDNLNKCTYDYKKLLVSFKYLNIPINNVSDDLMIMAYLLNINIKDDIAYLMNNNDIDIIFSDVLYKNKELDISTIANEAVKKAKFIYDMKNEYKEKIEKSYKSLYENIEMPLVKVLADMEYTGIELSTSILNEMKEEIKIKLDLISKEIYNFAGEEFNILSPKQLGIILFEKLHIPYPKKKKKDTYSTSVDVLVKLHDYPIVEKVLEYRTYAKLYSNYVVGLAELIKSDGKIHTTFNQTLTRTGRLSSTNPNLQNIPIKEEYGKLVRKAFIPSPNHIILSSDYSKIELRIFAHISKAENLIEAFNNGMDIHTKTAMDIFSVPEIAVTSKMRRTAKAVNFGILYGISSFGLSEDLGINLKDAKQFIDHYLETYPGIKNYMEEVIANAHKDGYVKTLFGRVRIIEELSNSNYMIKSQGERMALNTPIQGTSADILKKAMVEIYDEFIKRGLKSKMIIQVHDELVFDVVKEELDEVTNIVKDIMENTYKLSVPLKVEISFGNNWYEAK